MEAQVPKKPKKKSDSFDNFIKEYKNDPNDLRIVIWLSKVLATDYGSINLKKHEILKFLISDYVTRKSPAKKKSIQKYVKDYLKNTKTIPTQQELTHSSDDLWKRDILRAFGDPSDPATIAFKILEDINQFPQQVYNCNYDPDTLTNKLYELYGNGKSKSRRIYWRPIGKEAGNGKVGQRGSSNYWLASLNSKLTEKYMSNGY